MERISSNERQPSQTLKSKWAQKSPPLKQKQSQVTRSKSPSTLPPMPPKPSPSTIYRALATDNNDKSTQNSKDKVRIAEITPPPEKMPLKSQQIQSQTVDTVVQRKCSTASQLKKVSSRRRSSIITKTALPPLPINTCPSSPSANEACFLKLLSDDDSDKAEEEQEGHESSNKHPESSEAEIDAKLINQVQKIHSKYTENEDTLCEKPPSATNRPQSNKDEREAISSRPFKKLPPPPPLNKKYEHVEEEVIIGPAKAAHSVAGPLVKPPEAPPSIVSIPILNEEQEIQTTVQATSGDLPQPIPLPQLPPRPSKSTLARAHTIASAPRRLSRSISPVYESSDDSVSKVSMKVSNALSSKSVRSRIDLMTTFIYPDLSKATRNPPLNILEKPFLTGHKGTLLGVVASRNILVTASGILRLWDIKRNTLTNTITIDNFSNSNSTQTSPETSDRIRAIAIVPTRNPKDEGRYLCAVRQDTALCILDLHAPNKKVISKRNDVHSSPITLLLRAGNSEIWAIDQQGLLSIWNTVSLEFQNTPDPLLKEQPQQLTVTPRAVTAAICESKLWMSSGRNLEVHCIPPRNGPKGKDPISFVSAKVPNDMGSITKLLAIPYHPCRIFASHSDGKISIWNTKTMERVQVINVSMYGICTMVSVGEFHVWAGYNTGMIYVYDTRPEKWVVLKMWKAHSGAVTHLYVDESGLILDEHRGRLQVISGDSYGYVGVWDGLLTEHWKDTHLQERENEYCSYNDVKVMICSWNIDATKPDKITKDDQKHVRKWLGTMEDPEIIVVGIQEIIDLVSKKETARSLFFKRKIDPAEMEETRTSRYKLWLDFLTQIIAENYGQGTFTVAKTDELVGLFSCVFIRKTELDRVFSIDSTSVKTGLKVMSKSIHGNKGGIAIRLVYDHSSLCFVNCHLAAGQSHTQQRNADAEGILQGAALPQRNFADVFYHGGDGAMILDHEYCFLSGDLNYRIDMERTDVLKILTNTNKKLAWEKLQGHDQLLRQKINNPLFKLLTFEEAPIRFDPTYKYEIGTDFYDRSEKRRIPAWCDRVLFKGRNITNTFYRRFEPQCSDHRPIAAGFAFKTKIADQKKRDVVTKNINEERREFIDKFVRYRKARYVSLYNKCTESQASELLEKESWNVVLVVQKLMNSSDDVKV